MQMAVNRLAEMKCLKISRNIPEILKSVQEIRVDKYMKI